MSSCLMMVPESIRLKSGWANPDDPEVVVDFRLEEGQLNCFKATTLDTGLVAEWVRGIAPELRETVEGRRLCLRVTGSLVAVTENNVPVTSGPGREFINVLLEHMRQRLGLMTEVVAHVPSLESLRAEVDTFVRGRIQLAIQDRPESLQGAYWGTQGVCDKCYNAAADLDTRLQQVRDQLEHNCTKHGSDHQVFIVPSHVPGKCGDQNPVRLNVSMFAFLAVEALLPEVVMAAYGELVPQYQPGNVSEHPPSDQDLAAQLLGVLFRV